MVPTSSSHIACPISGKSDISPLEGYESHHLAKCKSSGFVFSKKIPSANELTSHYATYNRSLEISALTLDRYREIITDFSKYRKTNRLFDIGCGMGDFLVVAKEMGWEVYGNEYTQDAVDACLLKGIEAKLGPPDLGWFDTGSFDIVCSFEVIEHLSFPSEHVSFAHHLLRKGGLFYCTTPNFNAVERYLLKDKYNVIEYPEHLSYFTKNTLHRTISQEGFVKKSISSSGISPARIKKSLRRHNSKKGTPSGTPPISDEALRMQLESSPIKRALKNLVNRVLDILGVGNALKASYEKL